MSRIYMIPGMGLILLGFRLRGVRVGAKSLIRTNCYFHNIKIEVVGRNSFTMS